MNSKINNIKAAGVSLANAEGDRQAAPITCTVKYCNNKWILDVPGEGTVVVRDCKQARGVIAMLINMGMLMEPDDIEAAASTGPIVVHGCRPSERESEPGHEPDDEPSPDSDVGDLLEADDGVSDEGNEDERGGVFDSEVTYTSGSDPDLLMLCGVKQSRHTGDTGDYRIVRELDRRVAALNEGIAAEKARGHAKMAAALEEELVALRKCRDWYLNSINGMLRPFYPKDVEDKAKRCRMWIFRGLRTLAAKGLPKAAASLDKAINRGMHFIYEERPEYEWIVTPPPSGSLPFLGVPDDGQEGISEVAA